MGGMRPTPATLNVSLSEELREFIDDQIARGGYRTASEYLRELLREARKRAARERLEELLLEGLESGAGGEVTDEWLALRKEELRRRLREREGGG